MKNIFESIKKEKQILKSLIDNGLEQSHNILISMGFEFINKVEYNGFYYKNSNQEFFSLARTKDGSFALYDSQREETGYALPVILESKSEEEFLNLLKCFTIYKKTIIEAEMLFEQQIRSIIEKNVKK
jgi:hypothetical protein